MARRLYKRLRIKVDLTCQTPLHVGGIGNTLLTDMPLACNGRGEYYLPGTALAGPLRAWTERHFANVIGKSFLDKLWGFQPEDSAAKPSGSASRITVEDAVIASESVTELWDGVGIDRHRGAAATGIKYDRQVLPRGTRIPLQLTVDIGTADDIPSIYGVVGHLLRALQAGLQLGAATTRGLGTVMAGDPVILEEDWSTRGGVLQLLRQQHGPALSLGELTARGPKPHLSPRLKVRIHWRPEGPLMVKAPGEGLAVDILPMISATTPTELGMVLPGSAIKGVLRSQTERIVRTVLGLELPDTSKLSERQRHLAQLNVPLVNAVFGSAKRAADQDGGKEEQSDAEETSTLGRGALAVATCYAKNGKATPEEWQQIATAALPEKKNSRGECSPLHQALNAAGLRQTPFFAQAFHVAVDRWTGGGAEHFLYTALEPFEVAWEPLVLTLDLDPERLPQAGPALALLLLVLRDLVEGRIGLGFGTTRGYGSLMVEHLEFLLEGSSTAAAQALKGMQTITAAEVDAKLAPVFAQLQKEWGDWIDRNQVEATCANG